MPKTTRIYSVDAIQLALTKSIPPDLLVTVFGTSVSTGWSDIRLEPLEKELSPDGILDLAFVGVPPQEVFVAFPVPVTAHYVWKNAEKVIGVKVHARSNDLTRLILEDRTGDAAAALDPAHLTRLAGEFQGPPAGGMKTMAIGEEHLTTLALGEEHPTPLFGENGGPTTLALGEEGPPPTTLVVGEEGIPKTFVNGEENPPTHVSPIAENMTFTNGEHPASLPIFENPPTSWAAEHLPPWHDPRGPVETGGVNAFGRR